MELDVAFHNGKIPNALKDISNDNPGNLPRIIFLNINLPGLSGLEILERIRNSDAIRFVPVVVLTSSGSPTDIEKAYKLGASGYIIKPMEHETLIEKLNATLKFWLNICSIPNLK